MKRGWVLFAGAVLMLSGCVTPVSERRRAAMREQQEIEALKTEVFRLREQMEGLHAAREDTYGRVDGLSASLDGDLRDLRRRLDALEQGLQAAGVARERMRQEIVEELSRKVEALLRSNRAAAPRARVENGYEHVVQPGETLSEIAAAYNVRVETVVRANNLDSADKIRSGQKLFIPE